MATQKRATLAELELQAAALRRQINARLAVRDSRAAKKYLGRCFTTRSNYSCPEKDEDYWQVYVKVHATEHGTLTCTSFQTDANGMTRIERAGMYMPNTLDSYDEISPAAFERALRDLQASIGKLGGAA